MRSPCLWKLFLKASNSNKYLALRNNTFNISKITFHYRIKICKFSKKLRKEKRKENNINKRENTWNTFTLLSNDLQSKNKLLEANNNTWMLYMQIGKKKKKKNIRKAIFNIELHISIIMQIILLNCLSNPLFHYVRIKDKYSLKT